MEKKRKILLIAVIVFFSLTVVKDVILKSLITMVGGQVMGAPIKMSYFSCGLFTQKIKIKNFRLDNPHGFLPEPLLDIPEIRVDYVAVVDAETLQEISLIKRPALIAIAVFIGNTRLIDNCLLIPS